MGAKARFEITITGEYVYQAETGKRRKEYKERFYLLKEGAELHQVIKKRPPHDSSLLDERLKGHDPSYLHVRTHNLSDVKVLGVEENIPLSILEERDPLGMTRIQLTKMIDAKQMPIDIESFPSLNRLRSEVKDYKSDPEKYRFRMASTLEDKKDADDLRALNNPTATSYDPNLPPVDPAEEHPELPVPASAEGPAEPYTESGTSEKPVETLGDDGVPLDIGGPASDDPLADLHQE